MLVQCCNHAKQSRNNVATLCRAKNRCCESFRVTLSLLFLNLDIFLKNSTAREFGYIKHSDRVWDNRAEVSKIATSLFKPTFSWPSPTPAPYSLTRVAYKRNTNLLFCPNFSLISCLSFCPILCAFFYSIFSVRFQVRLHVLFLVWFFCLVSCSILLISYFMFDFMTYFLSYLMIDFLLVFLPDFFSVFVSDFMSYFLSHLISDFFSDYWGFFVRFHVCFFLCLFPVIVRFFFTGGPNSVGVRWLWIYQRMY